MLHESKVDVECKKVESQVQTQMANTKCRIDWLCKVQCKMGHWILAEMERHMFGNYWLDYREIYF